MRTVEVEDGDVVVAFRDTGILLDFPDHEPTDVVSDHELFVVLLASLMRKGDDRLFALIDEERGKLEAAVDEAGVQN